jgi:hypothetical protein
VVLQKLQHRLAIGAVSETCSRAETAATPTADEDTLMNAHLPSSAAQAPVWPPATQADRDRVHDAAIDTAHALRRAAISEFWRGADALVDEAVDQGRRAADRFAARLRQHAKQRHASSAASEL